LILNYAVPPSAYTPFQITNPLDGTPLTVYNLQSQYFGLVPQLYETNAPQSLRHNVYNGIEASATGRLPHGAFVVGGWTIENQTDAACDVTTNSSGNALNDLNTLRFCDQTGGLFQSLGKISGVPWRNEFKLQGNMPIKWGFEVNASLYSDPVFSTNYATPIASSYAGPPLPETVYGGQSLGYKTVNWTISPATKYPTDCVCPNPGAVVDPGLSQGAETLQLIAPGSRLTPRLTQFDMGVRKTFHIHEKYTMMGEMQVYNIMNANTVTVESQSLGTLVKPYLAGGVGGNASTLLNPRMFRVSFQFKF
jgi:hypothetical protein